MSLINIGDWIDKWSLLHPQKRALVCEDQFFTYKELSQRVHQFSHFLLREGIQKGDRISVLLHNSHQFLEIFFALSKIGAILVPLNWRLAGPELKFIIQDSGSRMLIFEPEFEKVILSIRPELNLTQRGYLCVGDSSPEWTVDYEKILLNHPMHSPSVRWSVGDEDPHILMYTSGTSGLPKGALLSHRKTFFNVLNADLYYHLTPMDVTIIVRPLFHSGGLLVNAVPLLYKGGTLVLKKRFRPKEILETIQKYRITVVEMAGTHYKLILQECDVRQYDLSSVRCFFTGGERIPISLLKEYAEKGILISQIFGQTETSTITWLPYEDSIQKMGSAGLPVFHGEVRVVDQEGKDVPVGEVGEIIVKGPILMSGYWNRLEETANTIREGWLYTGDLARKDQDGYFYIVDRKRDMYISGGENIYPAEIEKVLLTHPKIFEAGVVGVPDEKWGEVGKAFIVLKPGERMNQEEVLQFLQDKLARYKIPKQVEFVETLPKTASGKLQKYILKKWHRNKVKGVMDSRGQGPRTHEPSNP